MSLRPRNVFEARNVLLSVKRAAKIKWNPAESFFALFLGFGVAMVGGWELAWIAFRGFADPAIFLCFGTPFALMLAGVFRAIHSQAKRKPRFWQAIGWTASIAFTLTAELHHAKMANEYDFLKNRPLVFRTGANTKVYSFPGDYRAICAQADRDPSGLTYEKDVPGPGKTWMDYSDDPEDFKTVKIRQGRAIGRIWFDEGGQTTNVDESKGWVTVEVSRRNSWIEGFAP